jgi:hypothetical protein
MRCLGVVEIAHVGPPDDASRGSRCLRNQSSRASIMMSWTLRSMLAAATRSCVEAPGSTQNAIAFFPCRAGERLASAAGADGGGSAWLGRVIPASVKEGRWAIRQSPVFACAHV